MTEYLIPVLIHIIKLDSDLLAILRKSKEFMFFHRFSPFFFDFLEFLRIKISIILMLECNTTHPDIYTYIVFCTFR